MRKSVCTYYFFLMFVYLSAAVYLRHNLFKTVTVLVFALVTNSSCAYIIKASSIKTKLTGQSLLCSC